MKSANPLNKLNPIKDHLKLLALCIPLAWAMSATAAPISWGSATTIAGDSDVSTDGDLVYAYHWATTDRTVNGVTFTGTTSLTAGGGNVQLSGFSANHPTFSSLV